MMRHWIVVSLSLVLMLDLSSVVSAQSASGEASPTYARWSHGPERKASYFPIAVWLQNPRNAPRYQRLGINLYVGLWRGPTADQVAELKRHGMHVICDQNEYALQHLDEPTIVGWMHGDEPDNAQPLAEKKGDGPPIPAESIISDYEQIKKRDPTRPILLNLGQGVAWDGWHGRGVRSNHPEDYPAYVRGSDVVSFDIYPATHDRPAVAGKLWYVARGVKRLREWAGDERIVWNCIECTRISNPEVKPTPAQVKAEVWMSIIHGSRGLIYFCHEFQPRFKEAGLLEDETMARAVGAINQEIHSLATVINQPALPDAATVHVEPAEVAKDLEQLVGPHGIAITSRRDASGTYVFAVRLDGSPARGKFQVAGLAGDTTVEVIGEGRRIDARDGAFEDQFDPYDVHLYRLEAR